MLNDGQWHNLEEIQQEIQLNKNQIRQIIGFLKEYNFIIVNETKKEIRLDEAVRRFLIRTATS